MNLDYVDPALMKQTAFEAAFGFFSDRRLDIPAYDSALVLPGCERGGGVIGPDGRLVDGTVVQNGWPKGGYYESDEVASVDEEVVYLGMFYSCWGHAITDNLKHLWFLGDASVDGRIKRLTFVYTTTHVGPDLPENFLRLLRLLGFGADRIVRIDRPTRFRRVHVPDPCFGPVASGTPYRYTREYGRLVSAAIAAAGPVEGPADRSVYFTRTGWKLDRAEGEARIEKVFRDLGYEIVRPERLTFEEMVRLLSRVRNFAATDGSCAHNALFLPEGARAIVVRKAKYCNVYQSVIGQVRRLDTVYVDSNRSDRLFDERYPMFGPFFLYVNERLAAFAGIRPHFPRFAYCVYAVRDLLKKACRRLSGRA